MSSRQAELMLSTPDTPGFLNSSNGDLNFYMTDANQAIHIGLDLNKSAGIVLRDGSTSINNDITIDGNIVASNINVTGGFSVNNIPLLTTQWESASNGVYLLNSNVGIGTNTPTEKLHVTGNILSSGTLTATNLNFTGQLQQNGSNYQTTQWKNTSLNTGIWVGSNVGIQTSNPQFALDVNGAINAKTTLYASNLDFKGALTKNGTPLITNQWQNNNASNVVYLGTGSNLAIGKSSYNSNVLLDVAGSVNIDGSVTVSNVRFTGALLQNGVTPIVSSAWSNSAYSVWSSNVSIGINTSNPSYDLDVAGRIRATGNLLADSNIILQGNLIQNGVTFQTTQWSNIVAGGGVFVGSGKSVGIGTSNPGATLDVVGRINASTGITSASMSNTNLSASNVVTNTITATSVAFTTSSNQTLAASNAIFTNATSTTLTTSVLSNTTLTTTLATVTTQLTGSNVVSSNVSAINVTSSNATITTLTATTGTITGLTTSNATFSNIRVGILSNNSLATSNLTVTTAIVTPNASISTLTANNVSLSNLTLKGSLTATGVASSTTINAMAYQLINADQTVIAFTTTIASFTDQTASVLNTLSQATETRYVGYIASVPTAVTFTPNQWVTTRAGSDTFAWKVVVYDGSNNVIATHTSSGITAVTFNLLTGQKWAVLTDAPITPSDTNILSGTTFAISYTPLPQIRSSVATFNISLNASNAVIPVFTGCNITASNAVIQSATFPTAFVTSLSNSTIASSNITVSSNLTAPRATITTFVASNLNTSNANIGALTAPALTATTSTLTTVTASNVTITSLTASNVTTPTLAASNASFSNTIVGSLSTNTITTAGNVTIGGNLAINGTMTTVNTQHVELSNNLLTLNAGQTGLPSLNLQSGIEVDRGSQCNYYFVYAESNETFRIGTANQLQPVATRQDVIQNTTIPWWNSTSEQYDFTSNIVISSNAYVGVGTAAPTEMLHVTGNIKSEQTVYTKDARISGVLYINGVPYTSTGSQFNSTPGAVWIGSNASGESSNIGVGKSNPLYPIDVVGSMRATNTIYAYALSNSGTSTCNLVVGSNITTPAATVTNLTTSIVAASTSVSTPYVNTTTLSNQNLSSSNIRVQTLTANNLTLSNLTIATDMTVASLTSSNVIASNVTSSNLVASNATAVYGAFSNLAASNLAIKSIIGSNLNVYGDTSFSSASGSVFAYPTNNQTGTQGNYILMQTNLSGFTPTTTTANAVTGYSLYAAVAPLSVTIQASQWQTSRGTPDNSVLYAIVVYDADGSTLNTYAVTALQSKTFTLLARQAFALVRNEVTAYTIYNTTSIRISTTTIKPDALMVSGTASITSNLYAANATIPNLTSTTNTCKGIVLERG